MNSEKTTGDFDCARGFSGPEEDWANREEWRYERECVDEDKEESIDEDHAWEVEHNR